jgi:hypothetical protein
MHRVLHQPPPAFSISRFLNFSMNRTRECDSNCTNDTFMPHQSINHFQSSENSDPQPANTIQLFPSSKAQQPNIKICLNRPPQSTHRSPTVHSAGELSSQSPGRDISIIVCQHPDLLNPHPLPPAAFADSPMFAQPVKHQLQIRRNQKRHVETPPAIAVMQCC